MIGFGGYPGFGMTFSIMRIMVPVIFVLVFGIIIVAMVRGIGEWNKNNHSPKLSVPAKVVSRRTAVSHHHHHQGNGMYHTHTATSYYATFQVESGDRIEFEISDMEYGHAGGRRLRGADLSGHPVSEFPPRVLRIKSTVEKFREIL